ncbi:small ribosomal subunit protein uS14m-like [Saccoglossus kowalevskii]|uniref:28S ribosomal protein S14, mitochondrial-like n=1 Tax=Saccoglossus kowalevskii TaxID=10224 RepID=A0ABM0GMT4_SACKO|nr:PREDICTED: 28S ribosomal protein S14, mitochondrial-like [Saccoglossus kowalevskii]
MFGVVRKGFASSFAVVQQVCLNNLLKFVPSSPIKTTVRTYYADWRMLRDVKRRRMVKQYASQRVRLNSLRKNTILPKELQEIADQEIAALPRDSCPVRLVKRCAITSRPKAVSRRWRLSRIQWRILADANQLPGVIRSMW